LYKVSYIFIGSLNVCFRFSIIWSHCFISLCR